MSPGGPGVHAQGRQGTLGLFRWRKGLRSCKVPARSPHGQTWGAQAPYRQSKMALHIFPKLESQADVTDTAFFDAGMRKYLMLLVRNIKCFLEILGVVLPLLSQVTKTDPCPPKQVCSLQPYREWRPGSDTGRIGRVVVGRAAPHPSPGPTPSLRPASSPFPGRCPWLRSGVWKSRSPSELLDDEKLLGVPWEPRGRAGLSLVQPCRPRGGRGPTTTSVGKRHGWHRGETAGQEVPRALGCGWVPSPAPTPLPCDLP